MRGSPRLLKLLPPDLRAELWAGGSDAECPLQWMSGVLCDCEDLVVGCHCGICSGDLRSETLHMPACSVTKSALLMKALADLAGSFNPERYTPGDIAQLVAARHAASLSSRAARRDKARDIINAAKRKRDVDMHLAASRSRTRRIESLRDSMGGEAFAAMVARQVEVRRNKALTAVLNQATLNQTLLWWHSSEGRLYWSGPLQPEPRMVWEVLESQRSPSRSCCATFGKCQGLLAELVVPRLRRPLLQGVPATETLVLHVPAKKVALAAAMATQWNIQREIPGNACRCSVTVTVKFDRSAGERVPRVHVAGQHGNRQHLVLLDAASLDNLMPGDVISDIHRLVQVGTRVVATTGCEKVALALPRPHDEFDTVLRGPVPPTTELPVGWDVTDAATSAELCIAWAAAPDSILRLVIQGSDSEAASETTALAELQHALQLHFGPAAELFERRRTRRQEQRRRLMEAISCPARLLAKTAHFFHTWVLQPVAKSSYACAAAMVRAARQHIVAPVLGWTQHAWSRFYTEVAVPFGVVTQRTWRWVALSLRPASDALQSIIQLGMRKSRSMSCEAIIQGQSALRWIQQQAVEPSATRLRGFWRSLVTLLASWFAQLSCALRPCSVYIVQPAWQRISDLGHRLVDLTSVVLKWLRAQGRLLAELSWAVWENTSEVAAVPVGWVEKWWSEEPWPRRVVECACRQAEMACSAFCASIKRCGAGISTSRRRPAPTIQLARARRYNEQHSLAHQLPEPNTAIP